jgi:hypothetical protein
MPPARCHCALRTAAPARAGVDQRSRTLARAQQQLTGDPPVAWKRRRLLCQGVGEIAPRDWPREKRRLDGAGTRTAICANFGDPGRCDLNLRRDIAALKQLQEYRLALGLNARPERLVKRLSSQRVRDLNIYMLFGAAILDLPAVGIARTRSRDWSRPTDDLGIASHVSRMTAAPGDRRARWPASSRRLWTCA